MSPQSLSSLSSLPPLPLTSPQLTPLPSPLPPQSSPPPPSLPLPSFLLCCPAPCASLFWLIVVSRGSALETQRVSDFFPLNFAQKRAGKKNARDYPLRKKFKFISIRRLRAPRLPPPGAGRRRTRVVTVGAGAGAGEATDRSRRRRARATFPSYHLGRLLRQASGLLTTSCRSRTSEIIG